MKWKIVLMFLVIGFGFVIYKGNTTIGTTFYEVKSNKLPASFDGYKIVQLSDLHDAQFGENHQDLVSKVKDVRPDAVFITGDFIDSNRYELEQSLQLVKALQGIAPIYYVTGNHEISTNDVSRIKDALQQYGVRILSDEADIVTSSQNESIAIGGIEDPLSSTQDDSVAVELAIQNTFKNVSTETFKVLLSHRPELFDVYAKYNMDVTFSGHAHGGQFRIPLIGGLISPGQGFFPKLTSGVHEKEGSQLVVSRGIGNSIMPIRFLNQPEIVVVTLRKSE